MSWIPFRNAVTRHDWPFFAGIHIILVSSFCEYIVYAKPSTPDPFAYIYYSHPLFGFNSDAALLESYYAAIGELEQHVHCIPSSLEIRHRGEELPLIDILDNIASTAGTARPITYPISSPFFSFVDCEGWLLKRTHAHLPIHQAVISILDSPQMDNFPNTEWYAQEVVPFLADVGEIQVSVAGGQVISYTLTEYSSSGTKTRQSLSYTSSTMDALIDLANLT